MKMMSLSSAVGNPAAIPYRRVRGHTYILGNPVFRASDPGFQFTLGDERGMAAKPSPDSDDNAGRTVAFCLHRDRIHCSETMFNERTTRTPDYGSMFKRRGLISNALMPLRIDILTGGTP